MSQLFRKHANHFVELSDDSGDVVESVSGMSEADFIAALAELRQSF
jgi:hypothetical protein